MGFFKDFKEDFSQAVNELMPGEDTLMSEESLEVNTLEGDVDVAAELSKIDGLLEQVASQAATRDAAKVSTASFAEVMKPEDKKAGTQKVEEKKPEDKITEGQKSEDKNPEEKELQKAAERKTEEKKQEVPKVDEKRTDVKKPFSFDKKEKIEKEEKVQETPKVQEEKKMVENTTPEVVKEARPVSDEVAVITKGMIIKGDILTNGSLDIQGEVHGNVDCSGKLVITGSVSGNSNASEIFADAARIEGEVVSTGTVKIGLGSVIIGNVSSTSAVIAGAIKGDIDVQGPVVVDTSAVVKGNIKSRSVQINNGAVIDGFCSQTYADIDMDSLFKTSKEGK